MCLSTLAATAIAGRAGIPCELRAGQATRQGRLGAPPMDTPSSCTLLNGRGGRIRLLLNCRGTGLAAFSVREPVGQAAIRSDHDRRTPLDVGADDDALWHDGVWRSRLVQLSAAYITAVSNFQMSRIVGEEKIDDDALAKCDVLVIKTPTSGIPEDETRPWCDLSSGAGRC